MLSITKQPTEEQNDKIFQLEKQGYKLDEPTSISACGLVYVKGKDIYFFGVDGEIMHNPDGLQIEEAHIRIEREQKEDFDSLDHY